jgi:hypothetical protein
VDRVSESGNQGQESRKKEKKEKKKKDIAMDIAGFFEG